MAQADPPPTHVVMLVNNPVTRDTRVKKSALALADAGLRVTVVGTTNGETRTESWLGDVRVIRLPLRTEIADALAIRRKRRRDWVATRWPVSPREARGIDLYWSLRIADAVATPSSRIPRPDVIARIAVLKIIRRQVASAARMNERMRRVNNKVWKRWDDWRSRRTFFLRWQRILPTLLDYERVFTPIVDELAADVVHVHDVHMLAIGAHAVTRARRRGRPAKLVYDAHEYVRGEAVYGGYTPRVVAAYAALEAQFIHRADLVVTVSPEIAQALQKDYRLPATPTVVLNAPTDVAPVPDAPSVRTAAGLDDSTPLLVYSGNLTPVRGVEAMIDALALLPEVHLALVVPHQINVYGQSLLDRATDAGTSSRLHVLPPVDAQLVAQYLSSATLGMHGLLHFPSHDMALPNKLFEYLHGYLPLVVSDTPAMARFVRDNDLGEVYRAGDAEDLAAAVTRALPRAAAIRERLQRDDAFRAAYSWEAQADALRSSYATTLGVTMQPASQRPTSLTDVPAARLRPTCVGIATGDNALTRAIRNRAGIEVDDEPTQQRALTTWTHALIGTEPVFGANRGPHFTRDAAMLAEHGIVVGLVVQGPELRSPRRHRRLSPDSPFGHGHDDYFARLQRRVDELAPLVAEFDGPKFVASIDLLDDVPDAVWLPLVVDVAADLGSAPMERDRPVVVHAPIDPELDGTALVESTLERLHRIGLIEYRRLDATVDVLALADADIVLDGVALGAYGLRSCEGMALGRVVLCHLDDRVVSKLPADPPIVRCRAETIEDVLTALVADRDSARKVAAKGPAYVAAHHDGRVSAKVVMEQLGISPQ